MTVSIIIPTFNRAHLWKKQTMLSCLIRQTKAPFEVLLCDDNSSDDTIQTLRDQFLKMSLPFRVRLFRSKVEKKLSIQGPALAENILFKEASGDIILHVDDDGAFSTMAVQFIESVTHGKQSAAYFGQIEFVDVETGWPTKLRDSRLEFYPAAAGVYPMVKDQLHAWGAIWAAPRSVLLDLGGHEISNAMYRGNDSRLGYRLRAVAPCYFVTHREFRFQHYGLPTQYVLTHGEQMRGKGREERYQAAQDMKTYRETHVTPHLGNWKPVLIANGGMDFWKSGKLDGLYEEVKV